MNIRVYDHSHYVGLETMDNARKTNDKFAVQLYLQIHIVTYSVFVW